MRNMQLNFILFFELEPVISFKFTVNDNFNIDEFKYDISVILYCIIDTINWEINININENNQVINIEDSENFVPVKNYIPTYKIIIIANTINVLNFLKILNYFKKRDLCQKYFRVVNILKQEGLI